MEVVNNILTLFEINATFFLMALIFAATYFFVSNVALKRLTDFLVERDKRLDGRMAEVYKLRTELAEINERLSLEKKQAQKEASENFAKIRAEGQEEQRRLLLEAKQSAAKGIANSRESLAKELQVEMNKLKTEVPAMTQLILEQLLSSGTSTAGAKELTATEMN